MKSTLQLLATIFTMLTLVLALTPSAQAQHTIYAVTPGNTLVRFSSATPGTIDATVAITGAGPGAVFRALDFRPATGELYAFASDGATQRLFIIDPLTGVVTQAGADLGIISGTPGMDFDPVADQFRILGTNNDQNLRFNPNLTQAATDTNVAYDPSDPGTGADTRVVGAAYDNNFAGTTSTTLYVIEETRAVLARLGSVGGAPTSPNSGLLFTVGALGFGFGSSNAGSSFDIASDGSAFATDDIDNFYTVNLTTGAATLVGPVGTNIQAIAVGPPPTDCTAAGRICGAAFNGPDDPAVLYSISQADGSAQMIGPIGFERVSAMAFNAAGTLFGAGERMDGSNTSVLITIDPLTGAGTEVGPTVSTAITDLSFRHSDGVLFGQTEDSDQVGTINTGTGAMTLLPNPHGIGCCGHSLAFDPADTLLLAGQTSFAASGSNLASIDQTTGLGTILTAMSFSAPLDNGERLNAMDFDPTSGVLFGSGVDMDNPRDYQLTTVDTTVGPTFGTVTNVGPTQFGLDAIAVGPPPTGTNLAVAKLATPEPVFVGTNLTYTITITNNGPDAATNVALNETLDAAVAFVSAMTTQGICDTSILPAITCTIGDLANAAQATVTIVVTAPATPQTVMNNANVAATETDPNLTNNVAVVVSTVVDVQADLSVTKTDAPNPQGVGGNITYTVVVANAGPDPATNVMFTDTLSGATTTFVSVTSAGNTCNSAGFPTITCTMGTIASGANETVTIVVTATATGTVTDTASATATETDPNPANNMDAESTTVQAAGFTLASVAVSPPNAVIRPGQSAKFNITINPAPFVAMVDLSCSTDIPLGSCSLMPTTLTPGNLPATTMLIVNTTGFFGTVAQSSTQAPLWAYWLPATAGFGVLGLVLVGVNRKRMRQNRRALLVALLSLLLAASLIAGCGFGGTPENQGTPGGTYLITVTATGGGVTQTATVNVVVQGTN